MERKTHSFHHRIRANEVNEVLKMIKLGKTIGPFDLPTYQLWYRSAWKK